MTLALPSGVLADERLQAALAVVEPPNHSEIDRIVDTVATDVIEAKGLRARLRGSTAHRKMGAVPNALRVLGHSPAALEAYLTLSDVLADTRFDAREREAIALTVAGANACDYCASAHSFISSNLKVSDDEIRKRLKGQSEDARLHAALAFAKAVVDKKGWVDEGRSKRWA